MGYSQKFWPENLRKSEENKGAAFLRGAERPAGLFSSLFPGLLDRRLYPYPPYLPLSLLSTPIPPIPNNVPNIVPNKCSKRCSVG